MTTSDATEYGIGPASSVELIWDMWEKLRDGGVSDRVSLRVFEGHLYSLMDDHDFYEGSGSRKLINLLTFCWDAIRIFALKDEEAQGWFSGTGERDISRIQEEQEEMDRKCIDFAKYLWELVQRHTDDY